MVRTLRKLRAKISRTFVADCPACHKHFYGFHRYATLCKIGKTPFRIVCHRCAEKIIKEDKKM